MMHTKSMIADQAVPERADLLHYANELDEIYLVVESMAALLYLLQSHDDVDPHTRTALRMLSGEAHDLKIRTEQAARGFSQKFGFD